MRLFLAGCPLGLLGRKMTVPVAILAIVAPCSPMAEDGNAAAGEVTRHIAEVGDALDPGRTDSDLLQMELGDSRALSV